MYSLKITDNVLLKFLEALERNVLPHLQQQAMHFLAIVFVLANIANIHLVVLVVSSLVARTLVKQGVEGEAVEDEEEDKNRDEKNGKPEDMILNKQ